MFDSVLAVVLGIVLVLFISGFIANANTSALTATDTLLLAFVPTILLILIIFSGIKGMRQKQSGIGI